ncbi:MAG TPA: deoxyribose-phosphate aldolase [Acholeplasmatales bacterium]|jgi:deoxyribose-phosphate aldolase|nr:deoxyribose-phosphate aldolase [Bacilli bacterium]MBS6562129.1 deoxyribose-phosphate aldolase [Staphylococcus sp.]CDC69832.1 deoxyribose-phosphate aldolase [Staphylococcus sp. CAG:324]HAR57919.1 deoxyribose-phosphate aldolase [Acholeplasmatales bacterium]
MQINKFIDHTLLKAFATSDEIRKLCEEAKKYNFKSVCVNPVHVSLAKECLEGSDVLVCTVIGFPLGANTKEIKAFETIDAIKNGADEIDMVINIGKAKEHDYTYIEDEIKMVVAASTGKTTKVIIETCYLNDEEKMNCCLAAKKAKATFVKTSTGFGTGGATANDIRLMRETVGPDMGVKASGGIRNLDDLELMVENGATRIGASSGVAIMENSSSKNEY